MDTDTRSNIALVVSFLSVLVSGAGFLLNAFRDRPRVKVTSVLYHDDDGSPYEISVTVVNKGRRPVILRMLGGTVREGGWGGSYLGTEHAGIRLGEHEQHVFKIDKEGVVAITESGPDEPYQFMWVEDTLGIRHKIPKSREYIAKMYPTKVSLGLRHEDAAEL